MFPLFIWNFIFLNSFSITLISMKYYLMKAIRAGLCDESGATVLQKRGNSERSLSAGDVEPKDTC